jgi:cobalamin biosynthesis protein CobT
MPKASKKRPRDDIPSVPIGSPVWIVKSWRELPENRHAARDHVSYTDHCVDGVFATVEAANAEARRARDRLLAKYDEEHMYELQEEDEDEDDTTGTDEEEEEEDEGAHKEEKKANDKEPFVYCRDLEEGSENDTSALHVVVEKVNVR